VTEGFWATYHPKEMDPTPLQGEILAFVKSSTYGRFGHGSAEWNATVAYFTSRTEPNVEEALNLLMDRGLLYEPTLGVLKAVA
jgi:hypothetical protein